MRFILSLLALTMIEAVRRKAPTFEEPIIVVGGGLAGLSATIEALKGGAKVVLVDAEKNLGGNSAKASSGISATGTRTQEKLGISDSRDRFFSDVLSGGDRENDNSLVDILVDDSADAIDFLEEAGVDLGDVNLCGGHSVPRVHWIPSPKEGKPLPVGFGIIKALKTKIEEYQKEHPDDLKILTETSCLGLTSWNEYITGINVVSGGKKWEITGKAVILATGGFSADKETDSSLLLEFAPERSTFPTTNGHFARGDGIKMARAMGAQLIGMQRVQIHPTSFVDPADPNANTKFLAAEALRGRGAILINSKGHRFANELGRRDYLTDEIIKQCKALPESFQGGSANRSAAIMLMNEAAADNFGRPAFNFYANVKKFFVKYENVAALAKSLGIDAGTITKTFADYNQFVKKDNNKKDAFEKKVFPVAFNENESLYAALITPALHYTMGGLKIDKQAQVHNEFMAKPFKGLYAAGEVAGGVHGSNRIAGNSLLECVVFGRIAGRNAARINYGHEEL